MTETKLKTNEVLPYQEQEKENKLTNIKGITTSQVRKREKSSDTPAYRFLRTDEQIADVPTIFRIKDKESWIKPKIKKGSCLQVEGQWTIKDPSYSNRKSFTAYSYQILENHE